MFQVDDSVRWSSLSGVPFAGFVRWIVPGTDVLHITCDPKRCSEDHGMTHVAGASLHAVQLDMPTLF